MRYYRTYNEDEKYNVTKLQNKFTSEARISKTKPITRNLPIKLKSRFEVVAMADKTKNMDAVPPAARVTICPPLLILKANCNIGPSITPRKNVSAKRKTTPKLLFLLAEIRKNNPKTPANISKLNMIGLCAAKPKLILIPNRAPITVGMSEKPNNAYVLLRTLLLCIADDEVAILKLSCIKLSFIN